MQSEVPTPHRSAESLPDLVDDEKLNHMMTEMPRGNTIKIDDDMDALLLDDQESEAALTGEKVPVPTAFKKNFSDTAETVQKRKTLNKLRRETAARTDSSNSMVSE